MSRFWITVLIVFMLMVLLGGLRFVRSSDVSSVMVHTEYLAINVLSLVMILLAVPALLLMFLSRRGETRRRVTASSERMDVFLGKLWKDLDRMEERVGNIETILMDRHRR